MKMRTMTKTGAVAALCFILAACEANPVVPERQPTPTPDIDVSKYENLTHCEHKYDDSLNFHYHGQVESYSEVMFDEWVTTFTYTLIDDTKRHLNGMEVENYICESVED